MVADDNFRKVMKSHCGEIMKYLFSSNNFFSFFCYIHQTTFEPELPKDLKDGLKHLTLFSMSGYTFESAEIKNNKLVFEAGFGENNFDSLVSVPLNSILQITVEDNVIFVNSGSSVEKKSPKSSSISVSSSINAILANPKNKNLKH